eukprot:gene6294-6940_t
MVENSVNASSAGVGHYKGIMLCNRPFAGTQAGTLKASATGGSGKSATTFTCGVVPQDLGSNVPISMKEKQLKRPKKDSVLVKHKKWLADLQRTKDSLEEAYLSEMKAKEDAQARFQEHERKMREATRATLKGSDEKGTLNTTTSAPTLGSSSSSAAIAESKDNEQQQQQQMEDKTSKSEPSSKKVLLQRPAWAITEEKASAYSEAKAEAEEDDLLDFAKSLSYDKYIGDLEVKMMMNQLRKRISELEKEVEQEDAMQTDMATRAARREMLELMGNAEAAMRMEEEEANAKMSADSQAIQTAKALLEEDDNMQNVHSTKSVVAMLKTAKEKISTMQFGIKSATMPPIEPVVSNEPKVVIHEPNEGARLDAQGKNLVSNLPYMHRNPAV